MIFFTPGALCIAGKGGRRILKHQFFIFGSADATFLSVAAVAAAAATTRSSDGNEKVFRNLNTENDIYLLLIFLCFLYFGARRRLRPQPRPV